MKRKLNFCFFLLIFIGCVNSSKSYKELDCDDALIDYSRDLLQEEFTSEFRNIDLYKNKKSDFYYIFKVVKKQGEAMEIIVEKFNNEKIANDLMSFLSKKKLDFIDCSNESKCCESLIVINSRFNLLWFPESYEELFNEDIR